MAEGFFFLEERALLDAKESLEKNKVHYHVLSLILKL